MAEHMVRESRWYAPDQAWELCKSSILQDYAGQKHWGFIIKERRALKVASQVIVMIRFMR